jgi:hypothetical protein
MVRIYYLGISGFFYSVFGQKFAKKFRIGRGKRKMVSRHINGQPTVPVQLYLLIGSGGYAVVVWGGGGRAKGGD